MKDSYIPRRRMTMDRPQISTLKLVAFNCDLDLESVELWVQHIISVRRTFDPYLINIFQRVQEIWSEHEIQGSNS